MKRYDQHHYTNTKVGDGSAMAPRYGARLRSSARPQAQNSGWAHAGTGFIEKRQTESDSQTSLALALGRAAPGRGPLPKRCQAAA